MLATSIQNLCWTSRNLCVVLLIWGWSFPCSAVPAPAFREQLLLVDINRQQLNETVLLLTDQAGALYLSSHDLKRWRLRQPVLTIAISYQGEKYFPLGALLGVSHVFDAQRMTLMVEVRAEAFTETSRISRHPTIPAPLRPDAGGFINYELFANYARDSRQHSAQFELGYFNRFGVGTSNMLVDQVNDMSRGVRLESTWTVDMPEKMKTLRIGDAINAPGTWGRSVRFGGIQFGTNFGTQPGFDTFPSQSAAGQAVLPSTVDVFVNNALVSTQAVPPGPFIISNLPIVTGAGEVQLVVRDLFGREQLVTRPFYYSQALLREGLTAYSYELGFVRENFGIQSNDYGKLFGTGTYRHGVTPLLTGEIHAEITADELTAGAGGDYLLPHLGTLSAYAAGSRNRSGQGGFLLLGIDRQAQPWSFGARTQWASRGFTQIGQIPAQLPPTQLSSVNLSFMAGVAGSISAAYVTQNNRNQPDLRFGTLSYSVSLGKYGSFSLSALRNFSGDSSTSIFAMLNIPLSASTSVSFSSQSTRNAGAEQSSNFTTTLQKNLPSGEGYGYRLIARDDGYQEATIALQNSIGTYSIDAAQSGGATATRLNVSGGIALLGSDVFLSRRIDQSFAVARIPDYPDVRILVDNQPAGRTDAKGNALIPRLRAYDVNMISIDQRDLPLDAQIGKLKLPAVPYFRSGIAINFPIKRSHGATFTLLLEDGTALPVGATVQRIDSKAGSNEHYTVGYRGEVYVAGLDPSTRLRASWGVRHCEFDVQFTAGTEALPDLGTYTCKEVSP